MSRLRLIETEKYHGHRDRDRSRLGKRCRDRDSIESLADLCFGPPNFKKWVKLKNGHISENKAKLTKLKALYFLKL